MAGRAIVEAPHVVNDVLTGFDVIHKPERKFAVDFCGFAMNLKLVLEKEYLFSINYNFLHTKNILEHTSRLNAQQMKMQLNRNLVI